MLLGISSTLQQRFAEMQEYFFLGVLCYLPAAIWLAYVAFLCLWLFRVCGFFVFVAAACLTWGSKLSKLVLLLQPVQSSPLACCIVCLVQASRDVLLLTKLCRSKSAVQLCGNI